MKSLLLLAVMLLQTQAPANHAAESPTASIEGVVVDGDMKPVAGAEVSAYWDPMPPTYMPDRVPRSFSDSNGKFLISKLEPGGYRVYVIAAGFVAQYYDAKSGGASGLATGARLQVTSGQNLGGIRVRMMRSATISGRVNSETGAPLSGMDVFALRVKYDASGWKTMVPETGGTQSDDRGEYRIAGLGPGRYYIRAESPGSTMPASLRASLGRPPVSSGIYSAAFYPGTSDLAGASLVEVKENSEIQGINMVLIRQQSYFVRGHVADSDGKPPQRPMMGVIPIRPEFVSSIGMSVSPYCGDLPECINSTGAFEFSNVGPGSYWVRAMISSPTTPETRKLLETPGADPSLLPQPKVAVAAVQVANGDVENVDLKFYSDLSISGQVSIDDAIPSIIPGGENIRIGFRQISVASLGPARTAVPDSQGRFSVPNLTPGDYRIDISGLPLDVFALEARIGGSDVIANGLRVFAPQSDPLNIWLSTKSGRIHGMVIDSSSKPVSKAAIVLVPSDVRNRPDLYKTAIAGPDGRFELRGIAPGDYTALPWDDVEDYSYFNPDIVLHYDVNAKSVHVAPNSNVEIQVARIPANTN